MFVTADILTLAQDTLFYRDIAFIFNKLNNN